MKTVAKNTSDINNKTATGVSKGKTTDIQTSQNGKIKAKSAAAYNTINFDANEEVHGQE